MTSVTKCHFRCAANAKSFSTEKRFWKTVLRERSGTEHSPDIEVATVDAMYTNSHTPQVSLRGVMCTLIESMAGGLKNHYKCHAQIC